MGLQSVALETPTRWYASRVLIGSQVQEKTTNISRCWQI